MPRNTLRDNGWSRGAFAVVIAHSVLIQMITFSIRPTLSYASLEVGLEPAWLGVLSACFALPGLAFAIPAGRLTDRFGERATVLVGGACLFAAVLLALFGQHSLIALLAATALLGAGHLISVIGDQALLANRTTASGRDSVFGAYAFTISLGQGIGGALLAINATEGTSPDIRLQFLICTALGLAILAVAFGMKRSAPHPIYDGSPAPQGTVALLRSPGMLRALIASSTVITAVDISIVYFPAIGHERGFPAAVISALLVTRALAAMASRIGLGYQVRLVGRRRLMVGGVAVSAMALCALAFPLDVVWLIVVCAVFGFSNGVCQPLTLSWLSDIAPSRQRGQVMSMRIAGNRIAQSSLPLAVGSFSTLAGPGGVLVATGLLLGVASWLSAAFGEPGRPPRPAVEQ